MYNIFMRLCANAWAGSMDAMVGVGLAGIYFGADARWWHFSLGIVFALLPDILGLLWLYQILRGRQVTYDHHRKWHHRPFLMISLTAVLSAASILLASLFSGSTAAQAQETITDLSMFTTLCLLWHFFHDYPFGDGYLNWGWLPFGLGTPDTDVPTNHGKWLQEKWLTPSVRFEAEVVIGMIVMAAGLYRADYIYTMCVSVLLVMSAFLLWYPLTNKYHQNLQASEAQ